MAAPGLRGGARVEAGLDGVTIAGLTAALSARHDSASGSCERESALGGLGFLLVRASVALALAFELIAAPSEEAALASLAAARAIFKRISKSALSLVSIRSSKAFSQRASKRPIERIVDLVPCGMPREARSSVFLSLDCCSTASRSAGSRLSSAASFSIWRQWSCASRRFQRSRSSPWSCSTRLAGSGVRKGSFSISGWAGSCVSSATTSSSSFSDSGSTVNSHNTAAPIIRPAVSVCIRSLPAARRCQSRRDRAGKIGGAWSCAYHVKAISSISSGLPRKLIALIFRASSLKPSFS